MGGRRQSDSDLLTQDNEKSSRWYVVLSQIAI